jgi:hypothetical protein
MKTKKLLTLCAGLALAGLMLQTDVSFAQQGRGRWGGNCPYYGTGSQAGSGGQYQYQQGRGPGSASSSTYQQRGICDGTGPKGRGGGGRWRQGTTGSGSSGSVQQ